MSAACCVQLNFPAVWCPTTLAVIEPRDSLPRVLGCCVLHHDTMPFRDVSNTPALAGYDNAVVGETYGGCWRVKLCEGAARTYVCAEGDERLSGRES